VNFYQAQDQARRQTFWLVGLFSLAVLALILLTNTIFALYVWYSDPQNIVNGQTGGSAWARLEAIFIGLGWNKFFWITALVCGTIFLAMWFKWLSLRDGGKVVAESLGGRLLATNTETLKERQLLNVVEEMALAAGIPVPPVYVLDGESGINAFAAGLALDDAVIGMSRGAMETLNREQLQGVVAHEFSHILNGDMRLNLKIVAVLHGILMIAESGRSILHYSGRVRYRSRGRNGNGAAFFILLGVALFVIGWIGTVFGNLIRAAVGRQREYLADASAVQFTRNPQGIAGALRVIGGHVSRSRIDHSQAHELGHLFFSEAYRSFWLATHPPLEDRIQRLLPDWDGSFLEAERKLDAEQMRANAETFVSRQQGPFTLVDPDMQQSAAKPLSPVSADSPVMPERMTESTGGMSASVLEAARDPFSAGPLLLALLLDNQRDVRRSQLDAIAGFSAQWRQRTEYFKDQIADLPPRQILPLIDILMPAIKSLSSTQYVSLRSAMAAMIRADGRIDLLEWVLFELVRQHGDRQFNLARPIKPTYRKVAGTAAHFSVVISYLSRLGQQDEAMQRKAFGRGVNAAGTYTAVFLDERKCTQAAFTRAVHELNKAYPLVKPRLLKGLIATARSDDQVCLHERMIIQTIAVIWDCPLVGLE